MTSPDTSSTGTTTPKSKPLVVLVQLVFIAAVIIGGLLTARYLMKTGPEAKPKKFVPSPNFVQIMEIRHQPYHLAVQTMGTVVPAQEIELTAGVGGEIIETDKNFVPGGFFQKGKMMLQLDPTDIGLNIRELESELQIAKNELTAEMGNQRIAVKEFDLLGQKVSPEEKQLMLRKPQLATKEANLQTAQARLEQTKRDFDRTRVKAPFNAVVRSQMVHTGARVTATSQLATIAGTDEFWLKLLVPVSDLKWLTFPEDHSDKPTSTVTIYPTDANDNMHTRLGRLFRLSPDLEEQGRMAVIYAAVDDPLCLAPENHNKPKLLLGSYVRAVIDGTELDSVVVIPRGYLRDHETVWLMDSASKLEIRTVAIIAKTHDTVLIDAGLSDGEKLITTNLSAPVAGTLVKLLGTGRNGAVATADPPAAKKSGKADREATQ